MMNCIVCLHTFINLLGFILDVNRFLKKKILEEYFYDEFLASALAANADRSTYMLKGAKRKEHFCCTKKPEML
ncbi:MAG: hypothetical protein SAK29_17620 [Scytonema sp. PMC 1069.18]|nr:hypothetical protein [Scytonema sp. PMC 1069.18]MEC4881234.1 hypothetical protein [Scytonema sp. PMC 1070.18]